MGGVSPETCWAIKKNWNYKFYYTVAFFGSFYKSILKFHLNPLQVISDFCRPRLGKDAVNDFVHLPNACYAQNARLLETSQFCYGNWL